MPIPKGKKDHTIPNNNRGITLTPLISKVKDTLLLQRAEEWIDQKLDSLQEANRHGSSCIETAASLQEAVAHSTNQKHTV